MNNSNNLYKTFFYSRIDTLLRNDSIHYFKYLDITLNLFEDNTFEEINENMECFANLPDYGGTYIIKDSLILCTRSYLLGKKNDSTKRYETIDFISLRQDTTKYLIQGDTVVDLANKKIRLINKTVSLF